MTSANSGARSSQPGAWLMICVPWPFQMRIGAFWLAVNSDSSELATTVT